MPESILSDELTAFPDESDAEEARDDEAMPDLYYYVGTDGRTYQGYMPGEYLLPNDSAEQDRLDFSHEIYRLILDNKLAEAPIRSPEYALDIGTGTGIWALQFAEDNPTCHVIGTDLSSIQPLSWMPNCQFVQENSELQEWVFPNKFDYIHLRGTIACFNDVTTVMRKAFDGLALGGWIEFQDACFEIQGLESGKFHGTAMERWSRLVPKGAAALGRNLAKAKLYKTQLENVGFVDVHERVIHVPGGPWPSGDKAKLIGVYTANAFHTGVVDSFKNFLLAAGEMSSAEVDSLTTQVKKDIRDASIRWYIPMYVVYGRKPYNGEAEE
ncbi:hypothetical protein INS49_001263 [Diaporthe citri]|uniref:uncharacterized protein n=1 Tax=Diaporthe citri TaxID=83186 RepID=UPI001C7FF9AD|nr:uncharacterized protein INS49_001263 [Diaporthe citri]KAG6367081.1 hypothetical protein INS49_001263 [Diaporthe citri]